MSSNIADIINSKTILNLEQKNAAESPDEIPLLIIAGPGSGKTMTLLYRIIYLTSTLLTNYNRESILLLTFSKSAVTEMITRLKSHQVPDYACHVMTFHSFSYKIVKLHYAVVGYRAMPKLASNSEKISILKECINYLNYPDLKELSNDKKRMNELMKFLTELKLNNKKDKYLGDDCQQSLKDLYTYYQKQLRTQNLIEFGDMVPIAYEILLNTTTSILLQYTNQYKYILCDEYQDTNTIQRQMLLLLGQSGRITAVGDRDQLIYGFQGADIRNFQIFSAKFTNSKIMTLNINYRSYGPIVVASNILIQDSYKSANNKLLPMKYMIPTQDKGHGTPVKIVECLGSIDCELNFILFHIKDLFAKRLVDYPSDIAILCRDNETAGHIGKFLQKCPLDFGISLSLDDDTSEDETFDTKSIMQQYLTTIHFVLDPMNNEYCENAIPLEISAQDNARNTIRVMREQSHIGSLFSRLQAITTSIKLRNWTKNIEKLIDVLAANSVNLTNFIDKLVHISGEPKQTKRKFSELDGRGNIPTPTPTTNTCSSDILKTAAIEWVAQRRRYVHTLSLTEQVRSFLKEMQDNIKQGLPIITSKSSTISRIFSENQKVIISTIHKSKGKEFQAVLIPYVNNDVYGTGREGKSEELLDEDRRLLYVAVTRAKSSLCLSYVGAYSASTQRNKISQLVIPVLSLPCVEKCQYPPQTSSVNNVFQPEKSLPLSVPSKKPVKPFNVYTKQKSTSVMVKDIEANNIVDYVNHANIENISKSMQSELAVQNLITNSSNMMMSSIHNSKSYSLQSSAPVRTSNASSSKPLFVPKSLSTTIPYGRESVSTPLDPSFSTSRAASSTSSAFNNITSSVIANHLPSTSMSFFSYRKIELKSSEEYSNDIK